MNLLTIISYVGFFEKKCLVNKKNVEIMTPFLIWLDRVEIDELIALLLENNKKKKLEVFAREDLIDLTKNLLEENNHLIELIKKINPVNPSNLEDRDCDKIVSALERSFQLGIEPELVGKIEAIGLLGCKSCLYHTEQS